jgi:hypothetical protein
MSQVPNHIIDIFKRQLGNDCFDDDPRIKYYIDYFIRNIEKILNLDDRKNLSEYLQKSLIELDKKHLPEIINYLNKLSTSNYYNQDKKINDTNHLEQLKEIYYYEQKKIYNIILIEKLEIQIQEQNKTISLLLEDIKEMKSLLSSKSNSKKDAKLQSV